MGNLSNKNRKILQSIYLRPVSASVKWADIETLFYALNAKIEERAGSRIKIVLSGEVRIFHRPHPSPYTDKGALVAIRKWLETLGITP